MDVFKRNPNHFDALSGAGQIHLKLGHMRRALEFFRRAVEVNPNLEGPAQLIPLIEKHLRDEERNTSDQPVRHSPARWQRPFTAGAGKLRPRVPLW